MKTIIIYFTVCLLFFSSFITGNSVAKDKNNPDPPTSGFRAEYLAQLDAVKKKVINLENSIPVEKLSWRPSDDVRSISEVYLHIAFTNFSLLKSVGYEPTNETTINADAEPFKAPTTDKTKIKDILKQSYENVRNIVLSISDTDLEKKVTLFGSETTLRDALVSLMNHNHEHLGQSIAYARMNSITPPWTAEMQEKVHEKK